jgi:hypothetical protein
MGREDAKLLERVFSYFIKKLRIGRINNTFYRGQTDPYRPTLSIYHQG